MSKLGKLVDLFQKEVNERSLEEVDEYFVLNSLVGEIGEYSNLKKKQYFYKIFPTYKTRVDKEISLGIRMTYESRILDELGDIFYKSIVSF
jgi:hypothetical protein